MADKVDLGALFGAPKAETFLGLEKCDDLQSLTAQIALLGAPCATPYAAVGAYCRNGPKALREAISVLTANLTHHDFDIGGPIFPNADVCAADCGDLPFDEADAASNRETIRKAVRTMTDKGAIPVLLGGDDSIPIPMLDALAGGGPYTVLQLDAHIDWRDEHMGETMGLSSTMRRASEMAHIERIIQVGARGIGSARAQDYQDALDWGVHFVTAPEVARNGVEPALDHIPEGANIIICTDVDVLDPSLVPGVIGRAPGGLTYYNVLDLIKGAAGRGDIAAMNFVEFMPERDVDGIGALTVAKLVASSLGILARQCADG